MIHILALFLFFLLGSRLWLAAANRPFWGDEAVGITGTVWNTFTALLRHGPLGEASPSPLHYLLEKLWLAAWNGMPQLHWDLRVFFRVLPVLYWALAALVVFYFTEFFLRTRVKDTPRWARLAIAAGAAIFFHTNDFGSYYAMEDRSYSLWIFLSTLHFAFFLSSWLQPWSAKKWSAYLLISFFLVATTYVALAQVLGALALQILFKSANRKHMGWVFAVAAASTFVALYYYQGVGGQLGFGTYGFSLYFESLFTVVGKTFHNHGVESTYFVFPVCYLLAVAVLRREKLLQPAFIFAWGMLAWSFLLFLACQWKGNLFAPRYLSFLVPSAFALYVAMLWMVFRFLAPKLKNRFFNVRVWHLFFLWVLCTGLAKVPKYAIDLTRDIPKAQESRIYGIYAPECAVKFTAGGEVPPLEALSKKCRGFSNP